MSPGSIDTQQRALQERTYEKGRGDWGHAVTRFRGSKFAATLQPRGVAKYAFELAVIGVCYFVLAKAGLTLASIYSVRPRDEATVSTPVSWKEVERRIRIEDFTVRNVPGRVAGLGDLWKPLLQARGRVDLRALVA